MAGAFSTTQLPKRPGAYFNFQARKPERTIISTTGVVALSALHSWGPENQVVELDNWADFLSIFGQGGTTPPAYTNAYRAVRDAFRGEDIPGYGGAGEVLFYRLVGSGGAKSSKSLSNGTTNAITLTGRYKGSFGNQITTTVVANAADPTNTHDLVIFVQGVEAERWSYAKTNITDLAAQINGTSPYAASKASNWVVASAVTSGTALTLVSAQAFTGGDDGATLTPSDYSAAQTAFEPYRFSVFTFDNFTDATALTALDVWQSNLNVKGKRFVTVIGGASAEAMSAAVARSALFDDFNVVNLGSGTYTDADYGDVSTAQLAPRLAGIVAQRGITAEVTFARLAGLSIKVGNTDADIASALAGGVVAISRDSHATAPVRLELGITTFTDKNNAVTPVEIYGNLKFVRVMQDIENELTTWAEQNVIGKMQVNQATRDFVRGHSQASMATREAAGVVLPGWSVTDSNDPPPTPTDNFVALNYEVTLGRGLEKVLNTVVVG